MQKDRRSFYEFALEENRRAGVHTKVFERVTIIRPGGNDTAIVWDCVPRDQQGSVSRQIQETYPGIEQVMFVEQQNKMTRGQMAGGEFCGNATRSLGYMVLDGKDGEVELEISGAQNLMRVVVENGKAQTTTPIRPALESVQKEEWSGDYVIHLDGISFVLTKADSSLGQEILTADDEKTQKAIVMKKLSENGFAQEYPASGVLVVTEKPDGTYALEPFVYVKDTGSLYYETGCGSGSTAVGAVLAKETGQSIENVRITQPSGMDLLVSIRRNHDSFIEACVDGPIEVVFDGRMYLSQKINNAPKYGALKK